MIQGPINPADYGEPAITPFRGTISVMFSDAIIASTQRALVYSDGGDPRYFIPFEDIYFLFLSPSHRQQHGRYGRMSCWRVTAVGESADDVMCAFENPGDLAPQLMLHGTFDPGKTRIEIVPEEDPQHQVSLPE